MTIVNTAKNITFTLCIVSTLFTSGCYGEAKTEITPKESATKQQNITPDAEAVDSKTTEAPETKRVSPSFNRPRSFKA